MVVRDPSLTAAGADWPVDGSVTDKRVWTQMHRPRIYCTRTSEFNFKEISDEQAIEQH